MCSCCETARKSQCGEGVKQQLSAFGTEWDYQFKFQMNADGHPLMGGIQKPEVDRVAKEVLQLDKQDKRTVVPLEVLDFDRWLTCTVEERRAMLKMPPVELFEAGPVD